MLGFAAMSVAPKKPRIFNMLAFIGLLIAGFSGLYLLAEAAPLLESPEQYAETMHQELGRTVDRLADNLGNPAERQLMIQLTEKQLAMTQRFRGVLLPLEAMGFIVAALLFMGCARALQLSTWGLGAWQFAAQLGIPVGLLRCGFSIYLSHRVELEFAGAATATIETVQHAMLLLREASMFGASLHALYFAIVLSYLKREKIVALFGHSPSENA